MRSHTLPAVVVLVSAFAALCAAQTPDEAVVPKFAEPSLKADLPPNNFTFEIPKSEGVKIDMVYVPGGKFLMGSPDAEAGRKSDEGPQRQVEVRPYWLAKTELTWSQFAVFQRDVNLFMYDIENQKLKTPDAVTRPTNTYVDELYEHGRDGHPAICMSHHSAMMYCRWLQWKTGKRYRLPTEAEWEFACRAGTTTPYSFDDVAKLGDQAWFAENSKTAKDTDGSGDKGKAEEPTTHQVGKKKPNAFGLFDMHGNVWEWCLDQYFEKSYEKLPADKLSLGGFVKPAADVKWSHTVRGGSYADAPDRLRSAARRGSEPVWIKDDPQGLSSIWWLTNMDVIGFRIALPVEEYPELADLKPSLWKKPEASEKGVRKRVKNG